MIKSAFVIVSLLLLSSCASIVSGGSPSITINGNIREPLTIRTTKGTYTNVTLPATVKVNRHKLDGQRILIQSGTTRYNDIILDKKTNGWVFGNLLLGGPIGLCVDLATNAVSKPLISNFYINANDTQDYSTPQYNNYNNGFGSGRR